MDHHGYEAGRAGARPVIEVAGLTARYGEETILEDVSFRVYEGEIFVILGGSGSGKSTLLKHLIGLRKPQAGTILVNGVDIARADDEEMRRVRTGFGVLFQSGALLGSMTLFENVALPLMEYTDLPSSVIARIVKMKLAMVHLAGYENLYPAELSGGMKKRAGIARAMALDPAILFLDEPLAGLDPVTSAELDFLIKRINAGMGTTMVVVTHELSSILSISQRIIMLETGARGIIAEGDPRELKEHSPDPRVQDFFHRRIPALKDGG
jgi:phospholipid/cholesterol/gamma-HCH transport system ATP-binding protein